MIFADGIKKEGYFENNVFKFPIDKSNYYNDKAAEKINERASNGTGRSTKASSVIQNQTSKHNEKGEY